MRRRGTPQNPQTIASTPPPDPEAVWPHPDRPGRGGTSKPLIVVRDADELAAVRSGLKRVHLELPSTSRNAAFIAATPFTVRHKGKPRLPKLPPRPLPAAPRPIPEDEDPHAEPVEPVNVILVRAGLVRLDAVTVDDARLILGHGRATVRELQEWWLEQHEPGWAAATKKLTREQRRRRAAFEGTPRCWERWAERRVWRLEWERDLRERPRWPARSSPDGYVHSAARALEPGVEAIPEADQRRMTEEAQAPNQERRDNRHAVRRLATACSKRRRTLERYGVRSPIGGLEASAAITDELARLSRTATEQEEELARLAGEGRFPGHLLMSSWEDDR